MQPLSSYTLADPKVMQNPYPYYERLRAEDPVHFDEGIRTWLVTRYEDIVAVARNTEVFSDEMRVSAAIRSPFQAEVNEYMQREGFMLLDPADSFKLDGELHTRRRKLDKFDLDRTSLGLHLTFGTGVHFCLGAMLARQEMKCALKEIVGAVESLQLAVPPEQLDLSTSMVILRGLKSLPVRFRTRAA